MDAICARCGSEKQSFDSRCNVCALRPRSNMELLTQSMYLSTARFLDPEEQEDYKPVLAKYSEMLKEGRIIVFDESALAELRKIVSAFRGPLSTWDITKILLIILGLLAVPVAVLLHWFLS